MDEVNNWYSLGDGWKLHTHKDQKSEGGGWFWELTKEGKELKEPIEGWPFSNEPSKSVGYLSMVSNKEIFGPFETEEQAKDAATRFRGKIAMHPEKWSELVEEDSHNRGVSVDQALEDAIDQWLQEDNFNEEL